jgi:hypothetical protein
VFAFAFAFAYVLVRFEWAWAKKSGGKRAKSIKKRIERLHDRLSETQWTRSSVVAASHGHLNVHSFAPTAAIDGAVLVAKPFTVGGGVTQISNATITSVMASMYPNGFKP